MQKVHFQLTSHCVQSTGPRALAESVANFEIDEFAAGEEVQIRVHTQVLRNRGRNCAPEHNL